MKKFFITAFPILLFLIGLYSSIARIVNNNHIYEEIVSLTIVSLCLFGSIYSLILMKAWGGTKSVMGKGFGYLAFSFIFQALTVVVNYIFFTLNSYSPIVTGLLVFMNFCWGMAAYHFLIATGINPHTRKIWKLIIILSILVCCSMVAYGSIETLIYASEVFNAAILLVDAILIIEAGLLIVYAAHFRGGMLLWPVLFFCLGLVFQMMGDLIKSDIFAFSLSEDIIAEMFFCISWFLLCLSPITLVVYKKEVE